jgi:hypothetical protein
MTEFFLVGGLSKQCIETQAHDTRRKGDCITERVPILSPPPLNFVQFEISVVFRNDVDRLGFCFECT